MEFPVVGTSTWNTMPEPSKFFFSFHVYECSACMYASMYHLHAVASDQRRVWGLLGPGLQTVVNYHVSSGNQILDLWKSSQHSWPLSHLSSPKVAIFNNIVKTWVCQKSLCVFTALSSESIFLCSKHSFSANPFTVVFTEICWGQI